MPNKPLFPLPRVLAPLSPHRALPKDNYGLSHNPAAAAARQYISSWGWLASVAPASAKQSEHYLTVRQMKGYEGFNVV
jgi:hypothetical protein